MILDKEKAAGSNQTAFVTTTSNNEHIVNQDAIKNNFICNSICNSSSYSCFSETNLSEIWEQLLLANEAHSYLKIKNVKPYGIKQRGNELIIPMYDCNNTLKNLQRIFPDGKKLFLSDKPTKGCFYILGLARSPSAIYIAEGYATAATIYEASGQCTVVAFNANNLPAVAEIIKWEYPDAEIIICADNDIYNGDQNIGLDKATEAAMLINAKIVVPKFNDIPINIKPKPTDFNDLASLKGLNEVRIQLANVAKVDIGSNNINETLDETIKRLAKLGLQN